MSPHDSVISAGKGNPRVDLRAGTHPPCSLHVCALTDRRGLAPRVSSLGIRRAFPAGRSTFGRVLVTVVLTVRRGGDYAALSRQVRAARLLDPTPWRYGLRIAATVLFFVACWWAFVAIGDSWLVLGPAALLGLAATQIAFLGHEGGHQQITATRTGKTVVRQAREQVLRARPKPRACA
jgi:hypothetical protein